MQTLGARLDTDHFGRECEEVRMHLDSLLSRNSQQLVLAKDLANDPARLSGSDSLGIKDGEATPHGLEGAV